MPLPFLLPLLGAGLSGLGGLFGNKPQTQKQTTDQTTESSQSRQGGFDTYNDPILSAMQQNFQNDLFRRYAQQLQEGTDLSGYQNEGLSNINRGADIQRMILQQSLARRGLSGSPTGIYANNLIDSNRVGSGVSFLNQIPLLRRQLQDQALTGASNFLRSTPYGTRTTGTTNESGFGTSHTVGSGTNTTPGNQVGGLLGGFGSTLSALIGLGAFGKKPGSVGGGGSGNSDYGGGF